MKIVRTVAGMRETLAPRRAEGATIGLVPTMGALHEGHLSLIRKARLDCDVVIVSLFVNPTQFGEAADLDAYPRDERRDGALASAEGADILFAPDHDQVYPKDFQTVVEVHGLTDILCGAPSNRGAAHFRGVTTVVAKLLNICRPTAAYFGQKDFQQALVIKRMVRDLDIPVAIELCPTVREVGGLAMSSRNQRLSSDGRERALGLKRALDAAAAAAPDVDRMRQAAIVELRAASIEPEYFEILNADDLTPLESTLGERVVVAVAAQVGDARLIDNLVIEANESTAAMTTKPSAVVAA